MIIPYLEVALEFEIERLNTNWYSDNSGAEKIDWV